MHRGFSNYTVYMNTLDFQFSGLLASPVNWTSQVWQLHETSQNDMSAAGCVIFLLPMFTDAWVQPGQRCYSQNATDVLTLAATISHIQQSRVHCCYQ